MTMQTLRHSVESWLRQKHIFVSADWVLACTEFVVEEQNLQERIDSLPYQKVQEIKDEVYQQWLHADLKEIGASSLPPSLTLQEERDPGRRMQLDDGKYAVQLEWIVDVAAPAYGQLLKASGSENENSEVSAFPERFQAAWEPKKKRMMKFELHDGVHSVFGMEWKPLSKLHDKMPPGTKLYLVGPVPIVRGGTLFLTDSNLQVLGGDLDSTAEDKTLIDVLAKRIKLRPDELRKRFPNLRGTTTEDRREKREPLGDFSNVGTDAPDERLEPRQSTSQSRDEPRHTPVIPNRKAIKRESTVKIEAAESPSVRTARRMPITPPTPTQHRAVLNEMFGVSQSASSGDDLNDDDFGDDLPPDDDFFRKIEAIEKQEEDPGAVDISDQEPLPRIETTLSFHPNTQQVVSTSMRLHNFSGELDISRTGQIKVSTSPVKLSTLGSSRGALIAAAGAIAAKSSTSKKSPSAESSNAIKLDPVDPASERSRPWSPNRPPSAFQHDLSLGDDEAIVFSSVSGRPPSVAEKRKSEDCRKSEAYKRSKLEEKSMVETTTPLSLNAFDLRNDDLNVSSPITKSLSDESRARPFSYLAEFRARASDFTPFWCKCFIVTFLGKFRSDPVTGFHIDVKICDGASTFAVRISDAVCVEYLGFDAAEFLRRKAKKESKAAEWAMASKRLVDFNRMLMHVDGLFRLEQLKEEAEAKVDAIVSGMKSLDKETFLRLQDARGKNESKGLI